MSIAGGVENALLAGARAKCDAIQMFTKSSRQWAAEPYCAETVQTFHRSKQDTGIVKVIAHDSYLLNLGSPDEGLRKKSIRPFIDEMERYESLAIPNLIAHPGAPMGTGEKAGIKRIARLTGSGPQGVSWLSGQSDSGDYRRSGNHSGVQVRPDSQHHRWESNKASVSEYASTRSMLLPPVTISERRKATR